MVCYTFYEKIAVARQEHLGVLAVLRRLHYTFSQLHSLASQKTVTSFDIHLEKSGKT